MTCAIHKFTSRTISWEDNNDYPTLESRVKGSNCKIIFVWLAYKMIQIVASGKDVSPEAKLRAAAMWSLLAFIKICDHGDIFLEDAEASKAEQLGNYFLAAYQKMADAALTSNDCLFRLRPKLHYFAHLLNFVAHSRLNPRRYDLFGAECVF